ncbi:NAD-dependent epimerase/dehydratase family protein [Stutzerimonas stutzeri]|uniref:NAD-dependent epimerase/dehydratase family protein n=1 Tax=Stutzerimonas stutzeri TaxID=316 RepID=UPI00210D1257|nr:NAD-dependent epimerase/dehydratase family protein [Stutzerimonas stutzeri]MCQ4261096.1 NAD-dependent epimerase/dehydratase family protein [Stutzerimonas stutzeri]
MRVLVTGANGFVGSQLVARLLGEGRLGNREINTLTLVDTAFSTPPDDPRVHCVVGSIAEAEVLRGAVEGEPIDAVFHLASVPGGTAEQDFDLARRVNLTATEQLLEQLRLHASRPRFVFSSTIAVYGAPMPAQVDDTTPPRPGMSYASQKLIGEILLEDYSRRGFVDGIALRLPGIVARPSGGTGLLSGFMSDVFWHMKEGRKFVCPVSPDAVAWWMSVGCCVDYLILAAVLPVEATAAHRTLALPALRLTMADVVEGLVRRFGEDRRDLISYRPNAQLEAQFGSFPTLKAEAAEALGFVHDGDVDRLVDQAVYVS